MSRIKTITAAYIGESDKETHDFKWGCRYTITLEQNDGVIKVRSEDGSFEDWYDNVIGFLNNWTDINTI